MNIYNKYNQLHFLYTQTDNLHFCSNKLKSWSQIIRLLGDIYKCVKHIKIFIKIKEILDVNVPENFKRMPTGLDKIISKLRAVASQLLKYIVQFVVIINLFTVSSTNFVWNILQDAVNFNFTHHICLSTSFLVYNNAGQKKEIKQIKKKSRKTKYNLSSVSTYLPNKSLTQTSMTP